MAAPYLDLGDIDQPVVCFWYCRSWRSWGVAVYDAEGNQEGEAQWFHAKADAVEEAKDISAERGCPVAQLRAAF